jgi:hypothetical protein
MKADGGCPSTIQRKRSGAESRLTIRRLLHHWMRNRTVSWKIIVSSQPVAYVFRECFLGVRINTSKALNMIANGAKLEAFRVCHRIFSALAALHLNTDLILPDSVHTV